MANYVDLITMLNTQGEAVVEFRKLDGTRRVMQCVWGEKGEAADTYSIVFDVEADGYRRIRHDSIIRVG